MSRNTPEYTTIKKATGKLLRAVQNNIVTLGADLLAVDLINDDNFTLLRNEIHGSTVTRAADLVGFVTNQVEQNPKSFHVFVKVLMEDRATYKEALKLLEPIYRDPDDEPDPPILPSAPDAQRKPPG